MKSPDQINSEKPVNKIENTSSPYGKLMNIMARNAEEINRDLEKTHGLKNLVDSSLHMNTKAFSRELGGIYDNEDIIYDEKEVYRMDRSSSGADNENIRKFHKVNTPEEMIALHRDKKEKSNSNQAEMAITALMHKVLKERFLVVRTSMLDDYKNGIDNLILDKETGAIICAFDEVLENIGDKEKGAPKKLDKIKTIAERGGTRAKYGVSLTNKKIVRNEARNIPLFFLTMEKENLSELTNDLYYNKDQTTDIEKKLFKHLITSISEQKKILEGMRLPPVMKAKLKEFDKSLEVLNSFVVEK